MSSARPITALRWSADVTPSRPARSRRCGSRRPGRHRHHRALLEADVDRTGPVVAVDGTAGCRAGHGPRAQPGFERVGAGLGRHGDVVDEAADACAPQSLTYEMDTSTWLPAWADRSMLHSCQPFDRPDAACHSPVVPVGSHRAPPAVERLVVREERVDLVTGIRVPALGAGLARVLVGVPVLVGQRRPVVLADRVGFDELEVLPTLAAKTPTGDRRGRPRGPLRVRVLLYAGRPPGISRQLPPPKSDAPRRVGVDQRARGGGIPRPLWVVRISGSGQGSLKIQRPLSRSLPRM
jgi:hypothetical protein